MGSMGAIPAPPPMHTQVPKFSMWVGLPRGPTTWMGSPTTMVAISMVDLPTSCTTRVMVPASGSVSAMVSGIRSAVSLMSTMTNCPAWCFREISGASIT